MDDSVLDDSVLQQSIESKNWDFCDKIKWKKMWGF